MRFPSLRINAVLSFFLSKFDFLKDQRTESRKFEEATNIMSVAKTTTDTDVSSNSLSDRLDQNEFARVMEALQAERRTVIRRACDKMHSNRDECSATDYRYVHDRAFYSKTYKVKFVKTMDSNRIAPFFR